VNILCPICYSMQTDHEEKTIDSIDSIICEYEVRCCKCGTLVDYWAYGHWESECNPPNSFWFDLMHNKINYLRKKWLVVTHRDIFRWIKVFFTREPLEVDSK
jgi:hypothetical protein